MSKTYENFIEELIQSLIIATEYDSSRIYLKKKGEISADTDDRLCIDYNVSGGVRETHALFIKDLYEEYGNGISIEVMTKEIVKQLGEIKKSEGFSRILSLPDYDKVQQYFFIRLLNVMRNEESLQNVITKTFGDLAFVLYLEVSNVDGKLTSMKVSKEYLRSWNKDEDEVMRNALENTFLRTPPRIYHLDDCSSKKKSQGYDFMDTSFELEKEDEASFCLSTYPILNGSVALFLTNAAARLGELLGESYYIEFCDIHKCVIHKESAANLEEIRHRLECAAEDEKNQEFLSQYIFHYDVQTGHFDFME